ncbi:MAG: hypothetical protein HDT25_07410 [Ruminococcus sp.]|nr:hypothetical protein [Ruminococcus sp.]
MDKCIDLLNYRNKIVKEVQAKFSELSSAADDAEIIKYSTPIDGIGKFCPSLINFKIHPNRRRGRLLNNKPNSERYVKFYISKCGQPLRIRKFSQYGCDSSTYFYHDNEYVCAVPLFRETIDDYGRNIYIYKMTDERVAEYAEIDISSVYLEEYDYSNSNMVVCNMYEYYNSDFAFRDTTLSPKEINDFYSFLGQKINEKLGENIDGKEINFPTKPTIRINKWKYEITQSDKVKNINEFIFMNDQWLFNRKL